MLKEELRKLDSLLIRIADETKVPAGQALAVDRENFSKRITEEIEKNPNIEIIREEVGKIDSENGIVIIATGPLSSDKISKEIAKITGTVTCDVSFNSSVTNLTTQVNNTATRNENGKRYQGKNQEQKREMILLNNEINKEQKWLFVSVI